MKKLKFFLTCLTGLILILILSVGFYIRKNDSKEKYSESKWKCIGPFGQKLHFAPGSYYSGRINEIEITKSGLRIASASGGIFETDTKNFNYEPISDNLNSLVIGSFATNPQNENIIFAGTGDYSFPGIGLWKTSDKGRHWDSLSLNPVPAAFYKISFNPKNIKIIHAVTDSGYYRSDDGGETWERHLSGVTTDLAVNFQNPDIIYTAVENLSQSDEYRHIYISGIYKSEDGGNKWERIGKDPVLPNKDIGRTSISMCEKNSSVIYVSVSGYGSPSLKGVYKTDNDGKSWKKINPSYINKNSSGFYQGNYNNYISVSPADQNRVLLGWASLSITSDGGNSWKIIENVNVHADHHAVAWDKNGKTIYEGNDGGFSISSDYGSTWSTAKNTLPISQFYGFDVSPSNSNYIYGVAIDNGICGTSNMGAQWNNYWIGDCTSISVDPVSPTTIYYAQYGCASPHDCTLFKSTNGGVNYIDINKGIDTCGKDWSIYFTHMKTDKVSNYNLFANCDNHLFYSNNKGAKWSKLNPGGFRFPIANIAVSKFTSPFAVLYVSLLDTIDNKNKLKVYENSSWDERSAGLPKNMFVKSLTVSSKNNNTAYALMYGTDYPEHKIYKTTDRGKNWENISGDLPNVMLSDLIPNPENEKILYLGTDCGCYKSINGGLNWSKWNEGMPEAIKVTEMRLIEKSSGGKTCVAISTYGRGIWIKDISEE
jgi:photosystem II stability/assembly factor-like uncharacterized protein